MKIPINKEEGKEIQWFSLSQWEWYDSQYQQLSTCHSRKQRWHYIASSQNDSWFPTSYVYIWYWSGSLSKMSNPLQQRPNADKNTSSQSIWFIVDITTSPSFERLGYRGNCNTHTNSILLASVASRNTFLRFFTDNISDTICSCLWVPRLVSIQSSIDIFPRLLLFFIVSSMGNIVLDNFIDVLSIPHSLGGWVWMKGCISF